MIARGRAAAAVLVGLLAAAALALLAEGAFSVERDLAAADARLAAGLPPQPQVSGGLHFRIAETLLGAGDDRDLREALRAFTATRASGGPAEEQLASHGELEATLALLARKGDTRHRSLAANLNGILVYEDASLDRSSAVRYLELSLDSFRQAVLLDPRNEAAKRNLELLAALLLRDREQTGDPGTGDPGTAGAGSSPEGSGY